MPYKALKCRLDAGEIVLLDGGTGTELQLRGAQMDPAAWCVRAPPRPRVATPRVLLIF